MRSAEDLASRGERYFRVSLFEAAQDFWEEALAMGPDRPTVIRAYDGLGKIAAQRERFTEAIAAFDHALAATPVDDVEERAGLVMRLAVAHLKAGHRDLAFRDMQGLVSDPRGLSAKRRGIVFLNLGSMQGYTALYESAIRSLTQARDLLGPNSPYEYPICGNLGLSLLELRQLDAAQHWLEQALAASPGPAIHAVNGLAHIALLHGNGTALQRWSEAAFAAMWDGMISYEPEEMAHLAEVLGRMAQRSGHGRLAVRLFDHAQSFYGRSGRWERWAALNESIAKAEKQGDTVRESVVLEELTRWTVLLENMTAQELVEPRASQLADIRLFIATHLADAMGLGREDQKWLTYVCRLADVGLSAVGAVDRSGVEMSAGARELYEQHPVISVQLLDRLGLPEVVTTGIADHHERWDGRGFPNGKVGDDMSLLAQIFAAADWYARETTVNGRRHRAVLDDIQQAAGAALAPDCVAGLVRVFQSGDGLLP